MILPQKELDYIWPLISGLGRFNVQYEWKWQELPSLKDNVHICIYTKSKKMRNFFIYKNPETSKKARQFALRFYFYGPES